MSEATSLHIGAAYIRVSSDDQLEYSPDSQLKVIRDYARKEGYLIPDDLVFQDDGISGKSADRRPAFRLMIATAKEPTHAFESIFVWKYSRFARNQEEAIMYKNLLKKNGVSVRSISEPSSDSPFAPLIERIIEWMDEYYLINLSGEVRRGMKEKATRGEALGRAPFGYRVENKKYVPDENAEIVRYIFNRYASGVGYMALTHELVEQGVKTAKGRVPSCAMVEYILHNPAYIGKTRWSEEGRLQHRHPVSETEADSVVYVDGKHEALIDIDTWNIVQERLQERHIETKYRRRGGHMYMLKGVIRCGSCGATLIPIGHKSGLSLQCCNYGRGTCRVSHSIKIEKINEMVFQALEEIAETNSFVFVPSSQQKPTINRDWEKLIATEESKLARAKTAYLEGAFEVEEYKSLKESIEANISHLKQVSGSSSAADDSKVDLATYHNKVMEVLAVIKSPDVDEQTKNEALKSILDRIVFNRPDNTLNFFFAVKYSKRI